MTRAIAGRQIHYHSRMTNPTRPLQDKVSVVTGGGRGIGAAIARRLAELGALAVIAGRNRDALESTARLIREAGGHADPCVCDISSLAHLEALAAHVKQTCGKTDILVNNAGVMVPGGPLHELAPEAWERVMSTNLRGVYFGLKAFVPAMIAAGQGDIVNISSLASKGPLPNGAAYAASKWALNGLTYSVAEELRGHQIRVSLVCPGSTESGFSGHEHKNASRMLQPDDIAHAVAMLVTEPRRAFASEVHLRPTLKP